MSTGKTTSDVSNPFYVRVDWKETREAHVLKGDFPGMTEKELELTTIDDIFVQISGERPKEEDHNVTDKWHMLECARGKFNRRFRLPENVFLDRLRAYLHDGVLTIIVPKKPEVKPFERPAVSDDFDAASVLLKLSGS